ncbi:hypothetical protein B0H13DRAFT_2382238 [Mycena leptocephala]|nr:hypothetical protein B0H13DRAFT_2382238 [Mycena leptocephala]
MHAPNRRLATLLPVRDVKHRWNYTEAMIARARLLRLAVDRWVLDHAELQALFLMEKEWATFVLYPSTSFPSSTPPYTAAHHQERGPAGEHLPPLEAQVQVCVNANDAFVAQVAGPQERARIVDAICACGEEMMMHRCVPFLPSSSFALCAVSKSPQALRNGARSSRACVAASTSCYGCHVLLKALDREKEQVCLLIVSEPLRGDSATTLVTQHASHVWSKYVVPPLLIDADPNTSSLSVDKSLKARGRASRLREPRGERQIAAVFGEVAKSQWGSYCIQQILEHGLEHRQMAPEHLLTGLLEFATNKQGSQSRMSEPAKGARCAMIVDPALSLTGSRLIASVLPTADKDQRFTTAPADTLRGCKTGYLVLRPDARLLRILNL